MASAVVNDSTEYEVEDILDSRVVKLPTGEYRTEFLVKWVTDKPPFETWEPFELTGHLPLMMKKFQAVSKKKLLDSYKGRDLSQEALAPLGNFPVLAKEITSGLNLDFEHIPLGNEKVINIDREELRNNKMFWIVKFRNDGGGFRVVRDFVMQYYFPEDAAYFELKMKRRVEKRKKKIDSGLLSPVQE